MSAILLLNRRGAEAPRCQSLNHKDTKGTEESQSQAARFDRGRPEGAGSALRSAVELSRSLRHLARVISFGSFLRVLRALLWLSVRGLISA